MVSLTSDVASAQPARIADLSSALVRQGHQVTIYTGHKQDFPGGEPVGYTVVRGPTAARAGSDEKALMKHIGAFTQFLANEWSRVTPDVAHAHFWTSAVATQLAAQLFQIPTVQSLYSLSGVEQEPVSTTLTRRRFENLVAKEGSWLVASHTGQVGQLCQLGGTRSRMSVIPPAVDLDSFNPAGEVAPRSTLQRILTASGLTPGDGADALLHALRSIPEAELVIVGGPARSALRRDADARRLTDLAAKLGVAERIRLDGLVPHADMPALLRSADVVACLPSTESFGMVALEAMACGVPVVASAVGGLRDTVIPDITGRLVSTNKARECVQALQPILRQPFTRTSLGAAGRDHARSRYSWERVAADTGRLYHELVPHPAGLVEVDA